MGVRGRSRGRGWGSDMRGGERVRGREVGGAGVVQVRLLTTVDDTRAGYLVLGKATKRLAKPRKGSLVFELQRQEKPVT